jgi:single-stranded-DNA-specific exonuclease
MEVCRISPQRVESDDVAFRMAPRLNAAGRMAHANLALRLLTTDNPERALAIARTLDRLNSRRQSTEADITGQIRQQIAANPHLLDRQALLMAETEWHEGVLGIVAARLARDYCRPVVLLSRRGSVARGSARSIPGIDLYRLLTACEMHLDHFGGHAMAAGLSLPVDRIDAFAHQLQRHLAEHTLPENYRPRLQLDAEITLNQITPGLLDQLESLQPFGQATPEPLFMLRDIEVDSHRLVGGHHRQMVLKSRHPATTMRVPAIQFNVDPAHMPPARFTRLAFCLRWNRWNGSRRLQLVVQATDP